jgi:DNA-binding transcriptional MerR regulator
MRIGELAAATGASTRSLRYYEQQGLLVSERSASGQRHYPEQAVERVDLIKCLLEAGLSSSTIYDVLPCITDESLRTPLLEQRLHDELHRVDDQLASLRSTRAMLTDVITRYRVDAAS